MGSTLFNHDPCAYLLVNETPVAVKPYKFKMSTVEGFRYRVKVCSVGGWVCSVRGVLGEEVCLVRWCAR